MDLDPGVFDRVVATIEEHFEYAGPPIMPETLANEVHGWDSLAHAVVIMKVEDAFGITLPDDQIFALRNVGDLALAVQKVQGG